VGGGSRRGPTHPGFLEGVSSATRIFAVLGKELRVESIYAEAEALVADPDSRVIRLRLQSMRADDFIRNSQNVRPEKILREAVVAETGKAQKSGLYVAFLQSLAFVREQQGDLEDAEAIYRVTLQYPAPDLSSVIFPHILCREGAAPVCWRAALVDRRVL
jgi:hypothetical protein